MKIRDRRDTHDVDLYPHNSLPDKTMQKYYYLLIIPLIGVLTSLFIPFMVISASSIGCRFVDVRLTAVMPPTEVGFFCVTHRIEQIMVIAGLVSYFFGFFVNFKPYLVGSNRHPYAFLVSLILIGIPLIDLTIIGLVDGPVGRYNMTFEFYTGYVIFLSSFLLMLVGVVYRYFEIDK